MRGELLYISRENAGVWSIEKWSKTSGSFESRGPASSSAEKLAWPMAIIGQDPLETIYSSSKTYAGYTNCTADYHGV